MNTQLTPHESHLLRTMRVGRGYWLAALPLGAVVALGLYAYALQLRDGLIVTGMRDTVSWGLYITNFVFFIGISHVGALMSAILRITHAEWRRPITRMAEAITFSALVFGALMPIVDLGRPERVYNLLLHGRIQSPILWDLISIATYLAGSTLFLYLPMIPDLAICRDRLTDAPRWKRWLYRTLALNWRGTPEQVARLEAAMSIMAVLIIPIAVMVHTVVSWIFAMTLRPGWNSTIFGPYFVAGALASGAASVILAMALFRKFYHLEAYLTLKHFRNMSALALVLTLVYLYFNLSEYVTVAYKTELAEKAVLLELFSGPMAGLFWFTQIGGLLVPAFLFVLPHIRPIARLRAVPLLRPIPLAASAALALAVIWVVWLRQVPAAGLDPDTLWGLFGWVAVALIALFVLSALPALHSRPILSATIASALIVIQAWVKRYLIVVPTFEHPLVPVHEPSLRLAVYTPTWVEWAITAGSLAGFMLLYFTFSKLFPIVSIWETAAGNEHRATSGMTPAALPPRSHATSEA